MGHLKLEFDELHSLETFLTIYEFIVVKFFCYRKRFYFKQTAGWKQNFLLKFSVNVVGSYGLQCKWVQINLTMIKINVNIGKMVFKTKRYKKFDGDCDACIFVQSKPHRICNRKRKV